MPLNCRLSKKQINNKLCLEICDLIKKPKIQTNFQQQQHFIPNQNCNHLSFINSTFIHTTETKFCKCSLHVLKKITRFNIYFAYAILIYTKDKASVEYRPNCLCEFNSEILAFLNLIILLSFIPSPN